MPIQTTDRPLDERRASLLLSLGFLGAWGCTGPDTLRPVTAMEAPPPPPDSSAGPLPALPTEQQMGDAARLRSDRAAAALKAEQERAAALRALRTGPVSVRGEVGARPASWPSSAEAMAARPQQPSSKLITPEEPKGQEVPKPTELDVGYRAIHAPRLISGDEVNEVFKKNRETFMACTKKGPAKGSVRVRFLVASEGKVFWAEPLATSVDSVEVVQCTIEAVQRFTFTASEAGTAEVFYNIVYEG